MARLEARVAFAALLPRMPDLRLEAPPGSLRRRRRSLILRGLEALPVSF